MSRKPFLQMSKQGQSKRIKREMAHTHTHANINVGGNNAKQEILFSHKETVWPNNKNEFKNNNPDSCSLHSHSSPMQQPCSSKENVSVYPNVIDESPLSDIENETHETPANANITFPLPDIKYKTHQTPADANITFVSNLRHWALKYQVSHIAITSLLSILRSHKCFDLPADARTLLKTPVNVITRVVEPLYYFIINFFPSEICKTIYDNVSEENIKEIISDWLNQAKVRIRRRADRQNKASGSEVSEYNPGSNE